MLRVILKQLGKLQRRQGNFRRAQNPHPTARTVMISASDITPPAHRVGTDTKSIDRNLFVRHVPVLAARITAQRTGIFVTGLKKCVIFHSYVLALISGRCSAVLDVPRTRTVIGDGDDPQSRLVLLRYQPGGVWTLVFFIAFP